MSHKDMWIAEYERLVERFVEEGFSENEAIRRAELLASDSLMDRWSDEADRQRKPA